MTPDVANYADYYLRRLINSLEKPYDPDAGGESALQRLTNRLVSDPAVLPADQLEKLRDTKLSDASLAKLVLSLADTIVAAPKFAGQNLDINIIRALLYLQRADPRIQMGNNVRYFPSTLPDVRTDDLHLLDFGLTKNFALPRGMRLQVRFEAINAIDYTVLWNPNIDPRNANFGFINQDRNNPRDLQIGLRFTF